MLVIADDITGAAELAGIGWRYGLQVALQRDLRAEAPAADLLVLDSRPDPRRALLVDVYGGRCAPPSRRQRLCVDTSRKCLIICWCK